MDSAANVCDLGSGESLRGVMFPEQVSAFVTEQGADVLVHIHPRNVLAAHTFHWVVLIKSER